MDSILTIGTPVRIALHHWDQGMVGRTGIIAPPPEGVTLTADCRWIELDVAHWEPGVTDAIEIPEADLEVIQAPPPIP